MVDFSGEGYQEMAVLFNRYLKNFLTTGDPNGNLFTGIRGLFSGDSALPKWQNWTPDNKVSMVMDASAHHGFGRAEAEDDPQCHERSLVQRCAGCTLRQPHSLEVRELPKTSKNRQIGADQRKVS